MKFSGTTYNDYHNKSQRSKSQKVLKISDSCSGSNSRLNDLFLNMSNNKTIQYYINHKFNEINQPSTKLSKFNKTKLLNPKLTNLANDIPISSKTTSHNNSKYMESFNIKTKTNLITLRTENNKLKNQLENCKNEYLRLYKEFELLKDELFSNSTQLKNPLDTVNTFQKGNSSNNYGLLNRNIKHNQNFNFNSTINSLNVTGEDL